MTTNVTISTVEQGVFNYPQGMEGWRFYRLEYLGEEHYALAESGIWMPPDVNPIDLEQALNILIQGGLKDVRW
jgi:hypothetical protein